MVVWGRAKEVLEGLKEAFEGRIESEKWLEIVGRRIE